MYHMVQCCGVEGKAPRAAARRARSTTSPERGISDLSLRELAAAIGTSHRMLIHHFGSKEGLWVEVMRDGRGSASATVLGDIVPDPARTFARPCALVAPHLRPVAVAQRAPVLRDLRPGAPGAPGHDRAARRDRRQLARSGRRDRPTRASPRDRARHTRGSASRSPAGLLLDLLATGDVPASTPRWSSGSPSTKRPLTLTLCDGPVGGAMYTIGEFARLGRVSIRMLRHYDAIGLLVPVQVDRTTATAATRLTRSPACIGSSR